MRPRYKRSKRRSNISAELCKTAGFVAGDATEVAVESTAELGALHPVEACCFAGGELLSAMPALGTVYAGRLRLPADGDVDVHPVDPVDVAVETAGADPAVLAVRGACVVPVVSVSFQSSIASTTNVLGTDQ
jgi:hypothetical protein